MAVMTWKKLEDLVAEGRGQGHRDRYKPWIRIHRRNASARGNQITDALPGYRRASHFLAAVEWHIALLCLYLGAWDVREQFPLWPMPHLHPLQDLDAGVARPRMRGLLEIADETGIDHGVEAGSKGVPYVATLDLNVTLRIAGSFRIAGVSVKPHKEVRDAEPTDRVVERLELERRYLVEAEAQHIIVERDLLGFHAGGNLETFSSGARLPAHLTLGQRAQDFSARLVELSQHSSIYAAIKRVGNEMNLSEADANLMWRNGVWTRRIDLDITAPLELNRPLRLDGRHMATALALQLFGEVAA